MSSNTVDKRRVLIVGASGAIGGAIASVLDKENNQLSLHARNNPEKLNALSKTMTNQKEMPFLIFDVANTEQCKEVLLEDIDKNGAYYGVVLSAGFYRDAPFAGMSEEDWHSVVRTNLDSFYNVIHPLILPMIQLKQGGRIVVVSSLSGIVGNRGQANYSAAKAGLIAASKSLAKEVAKRKITVNCVAPGFIESDMTEAISKDLMKNMVPMQRAGTPIEVASCVEYLFSENAGYITGQVISINGGIT